MEKLTLTITNNDGIIYSVCTLDPASIEFTPTQQLMGVILKDDDGEETSLDDILTGAARWIKYMY